MKARVLVHLAAFVVVAVLAAALPPPASRNDALAAGPTNPDPWPRTMPITGGSLTIYQPQVDSWDGGFLKFRAAVAVKPGNGGQEVFGVIRASAHTLVDRTARMVTLFNYSLLQIDFPSLPDHGRRYDADLGRLLPSATTKISLDRLQGFLAVTKLTAKTVADVKNDPPRIIVSYKPAVLVPISGSAVFRRLPESGLERVVNTRALIISGGGEVFLHVYDGWMAAPGLGGPWHVATGVSPTLDQIADRLAKKDEVDLLEGATAQSKPSLGTTVPAVYVAEMPTELIVFHGQPAFVPISNTQLLWATNSLNDVIINTGNNDYYVLISGRWFRAPGLAGPWTYVASSDLPPDFRRIPPGVTAAEVLAAVAGTPQAKEALIADSIPQTAVIPRRGGPSFTPVFDGAPQFRPIEGTPLQYVVNSPDPIIEVGPTSFYALRRGVWFTSSSVLGPWSVATYVPDVIYSIPASSPLHYVTYVQIYWASPESVEVGYTPGYVGTVIEPDGVVVYGTGYDYPAWVGVDYYPPPPTYGVAVYPAYDPYADAAFGFAMGMTTEALLAPAPYWGPVYYNDYYYNDYWHGCCYNAGYDNFYGHYGSATYDGYHDYGYNPYTGNSAGTSEFHTYNSATGTSSTVHSYSGYNAYTGARAGGYNRSFYNQDTGTSGDVDRNAAYNPETGNFERTGSGSAYNPSTGSSADVQHSSTGNAYNGTSAGETTATVTNGKTGQTNTYGAAHDGNDVYAGSDGNVYRNDGSGWQENSGSGWHGTDSASDSSYLDQESQARGWGSNQYSSFANRGYYGDSGFSGGYRGGSFGGWGGGGGFGGGGFHRFGGRW
jgi:hypothetical protein